MVRVIFNADDFGYSEAVSLGIIKAHQDGVINSTTLMVNMESSTNHAVRLSEQNPDLFVGLHSNIVIGRPGSDTSDIPSLVNSEGYFDTKKKQSAGLALNADEILIEVRAQAEKFKELMGEYPRHIEGHPIRDDGLFEAIKQVATKLNVHYTDVQYTVNSELIRGANNSGYEIPEYPDVPYFTGNISYEFWLEDKGNLLEKDLVEIHSHPGYLDQFILDNSSYNLPRAKEVEIACSDEIKQWAKENNVEFVSFEAIRKS